MSLALVEEQRKVIRPILKEHNGREVQTIGDAFLVEFSSALDSVRCAYDIQRAIREFDISMPEDKRIHLRIGIHLGDVVESHGEISGDAVNVASRIEPLAEDGGVCLTRPVYESVHNKFELPLTTIGTKDLKNVTSPMQVYKMSLPWEESEVQRGGGVSAQQPSCAWCYKPIVGESIAYETAGGTLRFDTRECLTTYRKLQSVHGDVFR